MNCPRCGRPFTTIHVEDVPCMCDPVEIRNLLAARLAKVVEAADLLLQEIAVVIDPNRTVWKLALDLRAALAAAQPEEESR